MVTDNGNGRRIPRVSIWGCSENDDLHHSFCLYKSVRPKNIEKSTFFLIGPQLIYRKLKSHLKPLFWIFRRQLRKDCKISFMGRIYWEINFVQKIFSYRQYFSRFSRTVGFWGLFSPFKEITTPLRLQTLNMYIEGWTSPKDSWKKMLLKFLSNSNSNLPGLPLEVGNPWTERTARIWITEKMNSPPGLPDFALYIAVKLFGRQWLLILFR